MNLSSIKKDHVLIVATVLMCSAVYMAGSIIGGYYLAQALIFVGGVIGGMLIETTARE